MYVALFPILSVPRMVPVLGRHTPALLLGVPRCVGIGPRAMVGLDSTFVFTEAAQSKISIPLINAQSTRPRWARDVLEGQRVVYPLLDASQRCPSSR